VASREILVGASAAAICRRCRICDLQAPGLTASTRPAASQRSFSPLAGPLPRLQ